MKRKTQKEIDEDFECAWEDHKKFTERQKTEPDMFQCSICGEWTEMPIHTISSGEKIDFCRDCYSFSIDSDLNGKERLKNSFFTRIKQTIKHFPIDDLHEQVYEVLGYSIEDLTSHLSDQFVNGMSWDNYGAWHLDHIRPVCSFTYDSIYDEDFFECWSLSNLQPLWAKDNLSKGSKLRGTDEK